MGFEAQAHSLEISPVHQDIIEEYFAGVGLTGDELKKRKRLVAQARKLNRKSAA